MQTGLFIGIMAGLFAIYLVIGYLASRKNISSIDYLLAGKSLGIPAVTATLLAAQVGGGMFLGTAQNPFRGLLYIIGLALGLLISGLGLAGKMRKFNVTTVGEIFERSYQSPGLHHLCAFLSVVSFLGILIGQILAAKSILLTFAGIQSDLFLLFFWLGIVTYTMIGGFHTVIITDFFRIIFIILIFSGICIYSLLTNPVPFFSATNVSALSTILAETHLTWSEAIRFIFIPASFCVIEQDIAQKFFSARTRHVASVSALLASLLLILFGFVPFYLGIQGKLLATHLAPDISPLLPVLTSLTNTFFFTIAICGLLAAITSTTDSLLCAASSMIVVPFSALLSVQPTVFLSRITIFITGIITLIASYLFSESIIEVLVDSYEISIAGLFVPFIASLFLKDFRAGAAWGSAITGICLFLLFKIPAIPHLTPSFAGISKTISMYVPHATFITFFASIVAYGIGFILSKKQITPTTH